MFYRLVFCCVLIAGAKMTAPSGDDGAAANVNGQLQGHPNTETYFRIVWKAPGFGGTPRA